MKAILCDGTSLSSGQVDISFALYPGQVFVKVHAVSLTPFDLGLVYCNIRDFFDKSRLKGIGSSAFSGVVVSVGDGVKIFKEGDAVFGLVGNPLTEGCGSEYIAIESGLCAHKPQNVSHAEAASLVWDGMWAERVLRLANPSVEDSILITGGVSNFCRVLMQIAKSSMFAVEWIGASVMSSSNGSDREYSESVGADETFDMSCNDGEWSIPFSSGMNQKKYSVVIDVIGDSKRVKRLVTPKTGRYVSLFDKLTPTELLSVSTASGSSKVDSRVSIQQVKSDTSYASVEGTPTSSVAARPMNSPPRISPQKLSPVLETRYRLMLSTPLGGLVSGSAGREAKFNYITAIPLGDGEILERIGVLIETGELTASVEQIFCVDELHAAVELVENKWKTMRGCVVVQFVDWSA